MKKLLSLVIVALLFACEGPEGPPGFDGQDADVIPSFETNPINFNQDNFFEAQILYPFQMFEDDMVLVYILWESSNGQDIWRLMPQTVNFNDGSFLTYNFDFTLSDVFLFLDGNTNLNTLPPEYTQNQIFRIVVVPAIDFGRVDFSNLDAIIEMYDIKEFKKI